jgi:hypothetical protein
MMVKSAQPGEGGECTHTIPLSLNLPSRAKLWCRLQLRGQRHFPYLYSTPIWSGRKIPRRSADTFRKIKVVNSTRIYKKNLCSSRKRHLLSWILRLPVYEQDSEAAKIPIRRFLIR